MWLDISLHLLFRIPCYDGLMELILFQLDQYYQDVSADLTGLLIMYSHFMSIAHRNIYCMYLWTVRVVNRF